MYKRWPQGERMFAIRLTQSGKPDVLRLTRLKLKTERLRLAILILEEVFQRKVTSFDTTNLPAVLVSDNSMAGADMTVSTAPTVESEIELC
jgi:hypothetical protein